MKKLTSFLIVFLALCLMPSILLALTSSIEGLTEINGKYYASKYDTLYVFTKYETIKFNATESKEIKIKAIKVKVDSGKWETYEGNSLRQDFELAPAGNAAGTKIKGAATGTFSIQDEGIHTIYCQAIDELGNTGPVVNGEVIIDNGKPFIDFRIENDPEADGIDDVYEPAFRCDSGFYVGPKNRIFIEAFDLRSGVEKLQIYNVGQKKWEDILPADMGTKFIELTDASGYVEGWNLVRAKAVDNVGNWTEEQAIRVFLDVTAPTMEIRPVYGRINELPANSNPNFQSFFTGVNNGFHFIATDEGSGVSDDSKQFNISEKYDVYDPNDVHKTADEIKTNIPQTDWNIYLTPIKFFMTGNYYIYGRAIDNVGNVNYNILLHVFVTVEPPVPDIRADNNK